MQYSVCASISISRLCSLAAKNQPKWEVETLQTLKPCPSRSFHNPLFMVLRAKSVVVVHDDVQCRAKVRFILKEGLSKKNECYVKKKKFSPISKEGSVSCKRRFYYSLGAKSKKMNIIHIYKKKSISERAQAPSDLLLPSPLVQ